MNDGVLNDSTRAPLMEDPRVQELLSLLRGSDYDPTNLEELLRHITAMEHRIASAYVQMSDLREELRELQGHPIKTALSNSVQGLEQRTTKTLENLKIIKAAIIDGCKQAAAAFKKQGEAALNGMAKFFRVKDVLEAVKNDITFEIKECDRAIAKIEVFSQQYHEAGKAIKNMGHTLRGNAMERNVKPVGKAAKTLQAPYRANRAIHIKLRESVIRALSQLERLDIDVTARNEERTAVQEEKSSMLGRLEEKKAYVAREAAGRPAPERTNIPRETAVAV